MDGERVKVQRYLLLFFFSLFLVCVRVFVLRILNVRVEFDVGQRRDLHLKDLLLHLVHTELRVP